MAGPADMVGHSSSPGVRVNIGCGAVFHPAWVNLDLVPVSPEVRRFDLRKGLPFADGSVDAAYSSHVLEHLRGPEADAFLREQRRVLRPGGIIRVVVPDLEVIVRHYVRYLDELLAGDRRHEFRYDYTLLEMFDQVVRDRPGGELERLWASGLVADPDYVAMRNGEEARAYLESAARRLAEGDGAGGVRGRVRQLRTRGIRWAVHALRARLPSPRVALTLATAQFMLGRQGARAVGEGLFRNSGEVHRVMYDRFSLGRVLERHGFRDAQPRRAGESEIPEFAAHLLEVDSVGAVRKPDSLFMEARAPD